MGRKRRGNDRGVMALEAVVVFTVGGEVEMDKGDGALLLGFLHPYKITKKNVDLHQFTPIQQMCLVKFSSLYHHLLTKAQINHVTIQTLARMVSILYQ